MMKQRLSDNMEDKTASVWVFGYGSLTWKPGITYTSKQYGYIKGFKRRFWQGNTTHRGTPEKPGRVATLVKDDKSVLWGIVYELKGDQIEAGMASLTNREMTLGGYITYELDFYERQSNKKPISVLVYTATPDCDLYTGPPACMEHMALQIVTSHGHAGPNAEYVTKLADFTRKFIPEETDEHLFMLDKMVRNFQAKFTNCQTSSKLTFSMQTLKEISYDSDKSFLLIDEKRTSIESQFSSSKRTDQITTVEKCKSILLDNQVEIERDE